VERREAAATTIQPFRHKNGVHNKSRRVFITTTIDKKNKNIQINHHTPLAKKKGKKK
jgi:hypothetical protein